MRALLQAASVRHAILRKMALLSTAVGMGSSAWFATHRRARPAHKYRAAMPFCQIPRRISPFGVYPYGLRHVVACGHAVRSPTPTKEGQP